MKFFLETAAKNKGWKMDIISDKKPYLIKYSKGELFFYSSKYINLDVNHQPMSFSNDKMYTYQILKREGIDIIQVDEITKMNDIKKQYETFSKNGSEAIILKPVEGYGASGLIKISTYKEFMETLKDIENKRYCISTYFEHDIEMRMVVFKGRVMVAHPKYDNPKNSVRPKYIEGYEIDEELYKKMESVSVQVANIMKYEFVAVDFLINDNKESIILEINLNPNLFPYSDRDEKNYRECVKLYEKMFDYKEWLLKQQYDS